jgi:methanogenic corrinoid protein MtbC1
MNDLHQQASRTIMNQLDALARFAVDRQYALQAKFWEPYRSDGYTKCLRDTGYNFSYLAQALEVNHTALFLDYIAWIKVLFANLGFPSQVLITSLNCMKQALQETLPSELAVLACNFIDTALEHQSFISETLESCLSPAAPLHELASNYLDALLLGDRRAASQLILDSAAHGTPVKDIYMDVFQPCQHEIGRLWQMHRVSVAQEHFCTGVTQMIMSQLYTYITSAEKKDYLIVATSVGGELHEVGIRMVVDFLEMDGWNTYYLGANTPTESVLRAIKELRPDIVAISATISFHVSKVTQLIDSIRSSPRVPPVKILVGGYPFNITENLWRQVGADGYARSAQEAIRVAYRLATRGS